MGQTDLSGASAEVEDLRVDPFSAANLRFCSLAIFFISEDIFAIVSSVGSVWRDVLN